MNKKFKAILIVIIATFCIYIYRNNISDFIKRIPFFSSDSEEYQPNVNKSSYEYFFKSYTENC